MKNLLNIFKNEYKTIFTDGGTILVMVIAAMMYALFYSLPFGNQILRDVPIAIVDMDNSSLSREFVRDLNSSEFVNVVSKPMDIQEAQEEFFQNKIRAYILIPKDFEKNIFRGKPTSIAAFEDSSYLLVYKQVTTGTLTTAGYLGAKLEIGTFMKKGLSKQQAMRIKQPFDFVQIPLFNPAGGYENYIYPLVLVLILQQTMLVGVGILGGTHREKLAGKRRKRTKDGEVVFVCSEKYCEFSDNPQEIVLGKAFAYASLYAIHSLVYFLVFPAIFTYKMTYNFGLLFLLLIPYLFAISFLAQALIYFYTERENSLFMLVVTSLPLIFLPGFVWPKESIPLFLNIVAKLIPATPAIDAFTRINQMGADFSQVSGDFALIIGLCVLYFYLACKTVVSISQINKEAS